MGPQRSGSCKITRKKLCRRCCSSPEVLLLVLVGVMDIVHKNLGRLGIRRSYSELVRGKATEVMGGSSNWFTAGAITVRG